MNDLVALMGSMTDAKGNILIPGIHDSVLPVTEDEKKLYADIDFDMEDYRADMKHAALTKSTKEELLMSRWRFPSLSLHGEHALFDNLYVNVTSTRQSLFQSSHSVP